MKKHIALLLTLVMVLALVPIQAEAATKLTQHVKVETAKTSKTPAGTIRYINQMPGGTYFYDSYWGDNKSVASIQCNLASISMALSYTGIDKLPARMTPFSSPSSIVSGTSASEKDPKSVSAGVDRMQSGNGKYSPVVIWMESYHTRYGTYEHWVVVADRISDDTYYIVDPGYGIGQGAYYKAKISGKTLTAWGRNSQISGVYQFYNPSTCINPVLTMKYNANGGKISSSTYSMGSTDIIRENDATFTKKWHYNYGDKNGLPDASAIGMTRLGYTFKGWSCSKDGSTRVFGQDEVIKAQDICQSLINGNKTVTLYAIWEPKAAKITYKPETLTMHIGDSAKITASVFGVNAKTVTLQSDKTVVTAKKGELNWTPSSGKTGKLPVTVNALTLGNGTVTLRLKDADGKTLVKKSLSVNVVPLDAPKVKAGTKEDTGKPRLTWDAVDGATGYEVYRATEKDGVYQKMLTTTSTRYTNTSAKVGTKYYYKVKAISSKSVDSDSEYSAVKAITCDCAKPTVSIALKSGTGKPRLTWEAVPGATGYEIYRATSKNGTYTKIYTSVNTGFTNTSAKAGTRYYYKVRAVIEKNTAATGAYSDVVSIKAK